MRVINTIIVHCSDSDYPQHDSIEVITSWHLERNFKDIGYHYVITKDGKIHKGRAESVIGAHCKGENKDSIGICLTGKNEFSKEQFKSLEILCIDICSRHDLEKSDIYPHNHFDHWRTCPNFSVEKILDTWKWH